MFRSLKITLLLAMALFSCERHSQGGGAMSGDNSADSGDLRVVWETPQKIPPEDTRVCIDSMTGD